MDLMSVTATYAELEKKYNGLCLRSWRFRWAAGN